MVFQNSIYENLAEFQILNDTQSYSTNSESKLGSLIGAQKDFLVIESKNNKKTKIGHKAAKTGQAFLQFYKTKHFTL